MDSAVKIAKIEAQQETTAHVTEAIKSGMEVVKTIAQNKLVSIVVAFAILEALRGIKVNKGMTKQVYSGQSHVLVDVPVKEDLFPAKLVEILEGATIIKSIIESIDLSDIAAIAGTVGKVVK